MFVLTFLINFSQSLKKTGYFLPEQEFNYNSINYARICGDLKQSMQTTFQIRMNEFYNERNTPDHKAQIGPENDDCEYLESQFSPFTGILIVFINWTHAEPCPYLLMGCQWNHFNIQTSNAKIGWKLVKLTAKN